jgi:hypothetical protein
MASLVLSVYPASNAARPGNCIGNVATRIAELNPGRAAILEYEVFVLCAVGDVGQVLGAIAER